MNTFCKLLFIGIALTASVGLNAKDIYGVVYNADGKPLNGVQVMARGTNIITTTNQNGEFNICVPDSVLTLVCDYPGMKKASTDIGNYNTVDIYMASFCSEKFYSISIEDLLCIATEDK